MLKRTITYEGLEFEVEYTWTDAIKGNFYEPPSDGGVDEYFIFIQQDKARVDFTEKLSDEAQKEIIAIVEKEEREGL